MGNEGCKHQRVRPDLDAYVCIICDTRIYTLKSSNQIAETKAQADPCGNVIKPGDPDYQEFEDLEVRGDAARGFSLWARFNPRTAREIDVKVADHVHPELIRFLCLNLPKAKA